MREKGGENQNKFFKKSDNQAMKEPLSGYTHAIGSAM
jgi:hypothetical protein